MLPCNLDPSGRNRIKFFKKLQYLQATGSQYINSGVDLTNYIFSYDFDVMWSSDGTWYQGIGSNGGSWIENNNWKCAASVTTNVKIQPNVLYHVRYDRITNVINLYIDGQQIVATTTAGIASSTTGVFALGDGAQKCKCKLYYFKIYSNNVLVRDYIPALVLAGNYYIDGNTNQKVLAISDKPGLYDRKTNKVYVNQGTGQFTYKLK